jgi:hypothetical protein
MAADIGAWLDSLPLSRKRKNLARDFSDGVMMAEVLHVFYPKLVDLHNYEQGLRVDTKIYNWNTLNQKVFKKIGVSIDATTITAIANGQPGVVDAFLVQVRNAVAKPQSSAGDARTPARPKKEKEPPPPVAKPMTDADREFLVSQIHESEKQSELLRALEAKEAKLMELMRIKDAKIMKLMAKEKH